VSVDRARDDQVSPLCFVLVDDRCPLAVVIHPGHQMVIYYDRRGCPAHTHHVLLEISTIGQPDRRDAQPDERILIDQALAIDLPLRAVVTQSQSDGTSRPLTATAHGRYADALAQGECASRQGH